MMIDVALLKTLGGSLSGGAAALLVAGMVMFPSKSVYEQHESEFHAYAAAEQASDLRQQISDTVERASKEEAGEYKTSLCKSLDQAIAELCEIAEKDAMCVDREIYRKRAGCE
jgi:hypothetical protein